MVKPEKCGHLHLVYHFTISLRSLLKEDLRTSPRRRLDDVLKKARRDLHFRLI